MSRSVNHAARLEKYTPAWRILEPAYLNLKKVPQLQLGEGERLAVFACGCFWGAQHRFASRKGVVRAVAGFAGDDAFGEPTYEDVRSRKSSHLESVAVVYDPLETDYLALCRYFFEIHDPGQTGGVGPDEGPQYQSAVFYCDDGQMQTAREVIDDLRSRGYAVETQLHRLGEFYPAAEGHQNYYDKVGGQPYCHIWEKKF
ncbi:MAG: peptide-methionine (S)-S-oxide reductase MsrA [Bacteroidales bacterium]|nr:peptide-methionine (S)-S-oxide reductase MsrA [Bacteroidales bacterium]